MITGLASSKTNNGCTKVPIRLEANGSLIVVFRNKSSVKNSPMVLIRDIPVWQRLDSTWTVHFDPAGGAPEQAVFPKLVSWTTVADKGIQNYSGTATYSQQINLKAIPTGKITLDLGAVEVVASVEINGHDCGTVWKHPYALDIGPFLHTGQNDIAISVTNLWANRLIADSGLPESQRISWATFNPYKPGDRLLPSGLLGPVVLRWGK